MNFKQLLRRLKPKQVGRRVKLKLLWHWLKLKHIWLRFKIQFFMVLSLILLFIDYQLFYPHLYWITVYILIITLLIAFVQWWYREYSFPVKVPNLQFTTSNEQFKFSEIFLHEFDYVKETASQAMNDRHTMVNYFLLSAGVLLAGLGLMVSEEGGAKFPYRFEVMILLSLIFNAVGWLYFMQVVRLRQAWCESARAMNHLKLLYMKHCGLLSGLPEKVFRWNVTSIPEAAKKMTVFYFSALLISLLNTTAIVLASIILPNINILLDTVTLRKSQFIPKQSLWIGLALGAYHLFLQMSMYTTLLDESVKHKDRIRKRSKRLEARYRKKISRRN